MNNHKIYHQLHIQATPDKVFAAISEPSHLENWWPLRCSGTPMKDAIYNFNFTEAYNWFGQVTDIVENQYFKIKMTESDSEWNPTSLSFQLKTQEVGTLLEFCHKGWKANTSEFRKTSFCWAQLLFGLKQYLEKGVVIPFEERS
ncbi:MAG: SRPBCC domain-containing protein [Bacteroidota bacterium]